MFSLYDALDVIRAQGGEYLATAYENQPTIKDPYNDAWVFKHHQYEGEVLVVYPDDMEEMTSPWPPRLNRSIAGV